MLERLRVGPIAENVYILPSDESGRCIVVDPGDEAGRILAFLDDRGLSPSCILATHGHLDHTAAIPELLTDYANRGIRVQLAAHALDAAYFGDRSEDTNREVFAAIHAIGYFKNYWRPIPAPDIVLSDGDTVPGSSFRVLHTPGHTQGSISLYDERSGILVSGDTLFKDGVGRTDGPDSDFVALKASVTRLLALPPTTRVFPGHGEPTTIYQERDLLDFMGG
jgi:glyoxylase-like metal-dependent hydrolase (beta-lactamase superfamily II)